MAEVRNELTRFEAIIFVYFISIFTEGTATHHRAQRQTPQGWIGIGRGGWKEKIKIGISLVFSFSRHGTHESLLMPENAIVDE